MICADDRAPRSSRHSAGRGCRRRPAARRARRTPGSADHRSGRRRGTRPGRGPCCSRPRSGLLGGAGLAADLVAGELGLRARALLDHQPHQPAHQSAVCGGDIAGVRRRGRPASRSSRVVGTRVPSPTRPPAASRNCSGVTAMPWPNDGGGHRDVGPSLGRARARPPRRSRSPAARRSPPGGRSPRAAVAPPAANAMPRGADVGRVLEDLGHRQPAVLGVVVADPVAPDLQLAGGVELVAAALTRPVSRAAAMVRILNTEPSS